MRTRKHRAKAFFPPDDAPVAGPPACHGAPFQRPAPTASYRKRGCGARNRQERVHQMKRILTATVLAVGLLTATTNNAFGGCGGCGGCGGGFSIGFSVGFSWNFS